MCNLTENQNDYPSHEELMKDPLYVEYMERKHKEMEEYLDWYTKSLENKIEVEKDPYELTHINY